MKKTMGMLLAILLCICLTGCGTATIDTGEKPAGEVELWFDGYADWIAYEDAIAAQEKATMTGYENYIKDTQMTPEGLVLQDDGSTCTLEEELAKYAPWTEEQLPELQKLRDMRTSRTSLTIPCVSGQPLALLEEGGMIWHSSNTFNLPEIWFRNSDALIIRVSYLQEEWVEEGETGLSMIKKLNPSMPTPSNYRTKDGYKKVYEKNLTLSDRTVKALIYEHEADTREDVWMVYDDMLVRFRVDLDAYNEEWFGSFGFVHISEEKLKAALAK